MYDAFRYTAHALRDINNELTLHYILHTQVKGSNITPFEANMIGVVCGFCFDV